MGIEIIGKLTQKNNGDFKLVDLEDVDYDGTGKSAKQELENKIEDVKNSLDAPTIKADIQTIKDNQINLIEDDTSMEGISDTEFPTLTTQDKTLIGSINEVNTQCKDIANELGNIDLTNYVTKDELTQGGIVTFRDVSNGEIFTLSSSSGGGDTPGAPTIYNITNNLTNAKNSNSAMTIEENTSYSANITASNGYNLESVIVVMGGNDVTSSVYSDGTINISAVTGNLIITASATKVSTVDIPETNLLAYYDMSKDLVDGKIQDLSSAGQNLTLENSATLENGYLMNNGIGGTSAMYITNPVVTPTVVDISSGYTVFVVISDGKQSKPSPIFASDSSATYSQLCTYNNGIIHYSQDGFNNSVSATQMTPDKCVVALNWLPSGNDTIYINGKQKYQATTKVTKIHNKLYLLNGYNAVTSLKLYKIALYKGELSSADIASISNTLLGGNA